MIGRPKGKVSTLRLFFFVSFSWGDVSGGACKTPAMCAWCFCMSCALFVLGKNMVALLVTLCPDGMVFSFARSISVGESRRLFCRHSPDLGSMVPVGRYACCGLRVKPELFDVWCTR